MVTFFMKIGNLNLYQSCFYSAIDKKANKTLTVIFSQILGLIFYSSMILGEYERILTFVHIIIIISYNHDKI